MARVHPMESGRVTVPSVERVVSRLPSSVLYDLAHLAAEREQQSSPWRHLTPEHVDEALEMIAAGTPPALGWWRAHLPPRPHIEIPPVPVYDRHRPWQPWELVVAATELADDHVRTDDAKDILASLALAHGLSAVELADAYVALEHAS